MNSEYTITKQQQDEAQPKPAQISGREKIIAKEEHINIDLVKIKEHCFPLGTHPMFMM